MRQYLRWVVATAAMVGLAACSDSGTGTTSPASRAMAPTGAPSLDLGGRGWGYRTATFTLTSNAGTYDVGGFYTLTVPANGVCSLKSSYGPGTWDTPCQTLGKNESITVTATYGYQNGGPVVDFSPALRFNPNMQVTLSTSQFAQLLIAGKSYFSRNPSTLGFFGMYYVSSIGSTIVTDAASDPSVVTHVNLTTGLVWRRVKHFSGYNVSVGEACDPSAGDPNCVEVPPVVEGGGP